MFFFFFFCGVSDECGITFVFYGHLPVGESTRLLYFHARLGFSAWNHSQWTEVSCLKVCGKDGDIDMAMLRSQQISFHFSAFEAGKLGSVIRDTQG